MKNFGWKGTFMEFNEVASRDLVNELCLFIYAQSLEEIQENINDPSPLPQIRAWFDCISYLKQEIPLIQQLPGFLIFEYHMIRGGGRRPDVLLFLPGEVLVLEFKSYSKVHETEYTQTSLYVRDLEQYHSTVQQADLKVHGALVLTKEITKEKIKYHPQYQVYMVGQYGLENLVRKIERKLRNIPLITPEEFIEGIYQPLPSIIESARSIMRGDPLPQIKSLKSSNFDVVVQEVKAIVEKAKETATHHLVLVSGVPGAGKTFVGLTLAHDLEKAIYLSGNGPLVEVLQVSLKSETFVQALYKYKTDYMKFGSVPDEHVIIFDEAQRAWDAKKTGVNKSEPDIIIEIAKHKPWSVVIGLIGEGQEIHTGEESGIALWNLAIKNQNISVHAKHHKSIFPHASQYTENTQLHLNTSLRTHKALKYFEWVEAFIEGDFNAARMHAKELQKRAVYIRTSI